MPEKKCFKCGEVKSLSEFYAHKAMADGHLGKCKTCTKADVIIHRRDNDSVREYDRRRSQSPERKMNASKVSKNWREKNPEKYKAHNVLNNAIRDGRAVKGSCEACGSEKVHAHHEDYSKPLDVRWLCALHHHRLHASEIKGKS